MVLNEKILCVRLRRVEVSSWVLIGIDHSERMYNARLGRLHCLNARAVIVRQRQAEARRRESGDAEREDRQQHEQRKDHRRAVVFEKHRSAAACLHSFASTRLRSATRAPRFTFVTVVARAVWRSGAAKVA